MSPRARTTLFAAGAAGLAGLLLWAYAGLPDFGSYHGIYGLTLNKIAVAQRHATDVVTAVNFDYRALDTLGEEFILFCAVLGLAVLLREQRGEHFARAHRGERHRFETSSSALRMLAVGGVGPTLLLGIYVIAHGQLTPGGGFQGGVILAAALLLVFLAGEYLAMKRLSPHVAVEALEAFGAGAYGLIGVGGLIFAGTFFTNFVALGTPGKLLSGGTIPLNSVAVGIEVAGAFVLLWTEFLDQTLLVRGTPR